jgi:peptidoglycan-associated lipoprotein
MDAGAAGRKKMEPRTMISIDTRSFLSRRALSSLWVIPLLIALFAAGCSKKDEGIETDPSAGDGSTIDLPTETLPDPDFPGEGTEQGGVDSGDLGDEVAIELGDVFFDFDKFDLDAEDRATLSRNSELLHSSATARILIEGHCDERGTVQYNLALGEKRAKQARDYLVSLGVSAGRIDVVSYGKERPFAMGSGESVWSQNRRAHFVLR